MRNPARLLAALSVLALVAGCGSPHAASRSERFCSGLTDTCHTIPARSLEQAAASARGRIPDVSSYQGHPDWRAAKAAGIAGAIFKGGEYTVDPDAAYNNGALRSLHLWRAMYWFVRNTGCQHEASQITSLAHQLGVTVVVNDLEVPEAAGYAACLVPAEKAAHLVAVNYTAPGSWPGGSGFGNAPLWQAEYGPTLHPFWHPVVAWQCTDGTYGCVTEVPGIGADDVSINMGITSLGRAAQPPRTLCWGKHSTPGSAACRKIRAQATHDWKQYEQFHAGTARYERQAAHLKGIVASLELNKPRVQQSYTGPGLAYINSKLNPAQSWAARYRALHDGLVKAHSG